LKQIIVGVTLRERHGLAGELVYDGSVMRGGFHGAVCGWLAIKKQAAIAGCLF
jgi:hypothetical protein